MGERAEDLINSAGRNDCCFSLCSLTNHPEAYGFRTIIYVLMILWVDNLAWLSRTVILVVSPELTCASGSWLNDKCNMLTFPQQIVG